MKDKKNGESTTNVNNTSSLASSLMTRIVSNAKLVVEIVYGSRYFGMWQGEVLDVLCQQGLDIAIEEKKSDSIGKEDWKVINRITCGIIRSYLAREQKYPYTKETSASNCLKILAAELKSPRKIVRNLKKKSLWSRSLEEVMDKLVDVALFLNREIDNISRSADPNSEEKHSLGSKLRLGPAGLDLHYANIILQIDSIVARSSSMPPNARDILYQNLPPNIKFSLRSKILSFHVKEQLTVTEIKAEMEKTLHWLVPVATITAKAHHGFGWVGEWANPRSESNRRSLVSVDVSQNRRSLVSVDVSQIETLHYADKQKSEAYILELILWLNYLVVQSNATLDGGRMRSLVKPPECLSPDIAEQKPTQISAADQGMLQEKSRTHGTSKSRDFGFVNNQSKILRQREARGSYLRISVPSAFL